MILSIRCECWVKIQFWKLFTTMVWYWIKSLWCECWVKIQFWKLFTTQRRWEWIQEGCECWVKIQFWKLFTTVFTCRILPNEVWMLGKNTILKAIHNCKVDECRRFIWCECWVKIQFWKLFTTHTQPIRMDITVWMLGKNTILKAIHNTNGTGNESKGVNAG